MAARAGRMRVAALLCLCLALLGGCARAGTPPPAPYVLIHGGFGGGKGWVQVKRRLEAAGHPVFAPTLPGQAERAGENGPGIRLVTWVDDVVALIRREKLKHVVLVGHSLGGMVVAGVAERIPGRIAVQVYVDAFLPNDGESAFDLMPPGGREMWEKRAQRMGNGWDIPSSNPKAAAMPLATLSDSLRISDRSALGIPGVYILTIDPGMHVDAFSGSADRARTRGWPVHVLETGHLPQRTMPNELSDLLLEAARPR